MTLPKVSTMVCLSLEVINSKKKLPDNYFKNAHKLHEKRGKIIKSLKGRCDG